jgi:hypothetical protein
MGLPVINHLLLSKYFTPFSSFLHHKHVQIRFLTKAFISSNIFPSGSTKLTGSFQT